MALDLKARVSLDGSGFQAGLNRLENAGKHAFGELKQFAIAAFGASSIERMFHASIDNAKELVTAAQRLGTKGTEGLQVMRQAAHDSNIELESMYKLFEKINVVRAKALKGDEEAKAALKALGITDIKMATEDMIMGPLRNKALSMNAQQFQPLLKDIGYKGGNVIPFLKTDFEELGETMHKLGIITTDETAIKLKLLGEGFDLIGKLLVTRFGPALLTMAEFMVRQFGKASGITAGVVGGVQGATSGDWDAQRIAKLSLGLMGPWSWMLSPKLNPFDMQKAQEGYSDLKGETDAETKDFFDAFQKRMEKLQHDLENPPTPNFETTGSGKEAKSKTNRMDTADSLVRVGNFLGDSQGALVGIAERHLQETRAMHQTIKRMKGLAQNENNQDPAFA